MPIGQVRRVKHRCSMAIALKQAYCGLGIGTEMIRYLKELAKTAGYEQMELGAVDGNTGAKHLYEKEGFTVTGKHPAAMKYDDGTYRDEWIMSVKLI